MAETEYISKDSALACFSDWIDRYGHEHTADEMVEYQRIEDLPAADVRPVVNGKWMNAHPSSPMFDGGGPPYCSVCGKEAPLRSVEVNQWKLERGSLSGPEVVHKTKCFLSNFCPNCGADMRESNLDTTKGDQL